MIDAQLIETAKIIRKNYLSAMKNLDSYESDVRNLANFLTEKMKSLETIRNVELKKKPNKEHLAEVTKKLAEELNAIEDEEQKLLKKVESINKDILKLQKEEEILYKTIKQRYPNISDDDLKRQIQSHLKE